MRSRSMFLGALVLLFAIFLMVECHLPRRFVWKPTFAHHDAQPFGCMLFDSVMASSLPNGYTTDDRTLWQLQCDSVFTSPKAILLLSDDSQKEDVSGIMELVRQGHTALVSATSLWAWRDTLGFSSTWMGNFDLKSFIGDTITRSYVKFMDDGSTYLLNHDLVGGFEVPDSVPCHVLARAFDVNMDNGVIPAEAVDTLSDEDMKVIAVSLSVGKGRIIVVATPLLMTNYGILNPDAGSYVWKIMSQVAHLPVIRVQGSCERMENRQESSIFYVLLERPPMRWALYLVLTTIVVFCIFTARRRQRAVPVIRQPQNHSLEFVKLIGTLYYQESDHAGLLKKKLTYTAGEIRRVTGIDILDDDDSDACEQLARIVGREPQQLRFVLRNIKEAVQRDHVVTVSEMRQFVDELNQISQNL